MVVVVVVAFSLHVMIIWKIMNCSPLAQFQKMEIASRVQVPIVSGT